MLVLLCSSRSFVCRIVSCKGVEPPNDTEIENVKGVNDVNTLGVKELTNFERGFNASGMRQSTRRGTASHKTELMDERDDLEGKVRWIIWNSVSENYQSRASSSLAHRAQIFSRSLTLIADRIGYFSSSAMGKILENHHGNRAASVGTGP